VRGPFNCRASSSKSASLRSEMAGPRIAGASIPPERPTSLGNDRCGNSPPSEPGLRARLNRDQRIENFHARQCRAITRDCP
jgi:hypothetical protein